MRLGIQPPHVGPGGRPLTLDEISANARLAEEIGFNGLWKGHHVPVPGDPRRCLPDPLIHLMLAGMATTTIELGTSIYQVPLANAGELAQRLYTIQSFVPGRFTFGVGTGSQRSEYAEAGLVWEERFSRLDAHMSYIRSVYEKREDPAVEPMFGDKGGFPSKPSAPSSDVLPLPLQVGMPRTMLGCWLSEQQLRRAVHQYDGWMGSSLAGSHHGGWRPFVVDAIKRYRDMGGRRAALTTVFIDLSQPEAALKDDGGFDLLCGPRSAAERIQILLELGYDDLIVIPRDDEGAFNSLGFTREKLEQIRALVPADDRDYR